MVAMWSSKEKCFADFFLSCLFLVFRISYYIKKYVYLTFYTGHDTVYIHSIYFLFQRGGVSAAFQIGATSFG